MESRRVLNLCLCLLVALGSANAKVEEEDPEFWRAKAQKTLQAALDRKLNTNVAKNIVFFLGDGMGMSTYTAGRILKGQLENRTGEETVMTMDTFPHVGLAKTYGVDYQVTDGAATATAYLCGVKTNFKLIGLSAAAHECDCKSQKGNEVTSILKWAKDAGKSVGIVTNMRVQHASPATTYAHSSSRNWYSDADLPAAAKTGNCEDISSQLLSNTVIDVIMGGGRKYMTPKGTADPEYPKDVASRGQRLDGRNLIDEWMPMRCHNNKVAHYVWNKTAFDAVNPETTDYLMALFAPKDMRYDVYRDPLMDPSIAEMTDKAIRVLRKNPKGFFLLVEGGLINIAHHNNRASMALHETVAFDNAIARSLELTNEDETLTVVTADHSFPFVFQGYGFRGASILGKSASLDRDSMPFTTLMYTNGPGYVNGSRPDLRDVDTTANDYVQLSAVPREFSTHSGEDVAVLARGPMAHLFQGVHEQSYIPHAMAYAACVGSDQRHCSTSQSVQSVQSFSING